MGLLALVRPGSCLEQLSQAVLNPSSFEQVSGLPVVARQSCIGDCCVVEGPLGFGDPPKLPLHIADAFLGRSCLLSHLTLVPRL